MAQRKEEFNRRLVENLCINLKDGQIAVVDFEDFAGTNKDFITVAKAYGFKIVENGAYEIIIRK